MPDTSAAAARHNPSDVTTQSAPAVSVVIPTYRPDHRLAALVGSLAALLPKWSEIIIVDDGTPPGGRSAIDRLEHPADDFNAPAGPVGVRFIHLPKNHGQQRATLAGIMAARGAVIVTMDDDGAHPPAAVPRMLHRLSVLPAGRGLVYGAPPDRQGLSLRSVGTVLNRAVFRVAMRVPGHIPITSFRAFHRECAHVIAGRVPHFPNLSAMLLAGSPCLGLVRHSRTRQSTSRLNARKLIVAFAVLVFRWGIPALFSRISRFGHDTRERRGAGPPGAGLPGPGRRLLILGGSIAQLGAIGKARGAGLHVIVADRDPTAVGCAAADAVAAASTFDQDAVLEAAKKHQPDGILVVATDQPIHVAAAVSEQLGLPFPITSRTATRATNKAMMKTTLEAAGIPTPLFAIVPAQIPESELPAALASLTPPLVVKPVDNQGQRGVALCVTMHEVNSALRRTRDFTRSHVALVEEFYASSEVTVSGWVDRGNAVILSVTDRVTIPSQTSLGVCAAHRFPSAAAEGFLGEICHLTRRVVKAFHIDSGPLYLQMLIGANGVKVNEVACRVGGAFEDQSLPEVTGVDVVSRAISESLGDPVPPFKTTRRGFVRTSGSFLVPLLYCEPGVIAHLSQLDAARQLPGIVAVNWVVRPGTEIATMTDSSQRVGYAIVVGENREQANARLKDLWKHLVVISQTSAQMLMDTLSLSLHPSSASRTR